MNMPLKWPKGKPGPSAVFHSNDCEPDWGQRLSSHEWPWGTVNKGRIKGMEVGGEAQRQTMHYSCENADGALTFHWAIWLHTSRRNAPEAACSSPKTPCVHASSPRLDTSTLVQRCSVSRIRRTSVHSALWREPYPTSLFLFCLFFCQDTRVAFLGMRWRLQLLASKRIH